MRKIIHCSYFLLIVSLISSLPGCRKTIDYHVYEGRKREPQQLATIVAEYRGLSVLSLDGQRAPLIRKRNIGRFFILPKHQKIKYLIQERTPAISSTDPLTKIETVHRPAQKFKKNGEIWITAEAGIHYSIRVQGNPPYWHVWIEETESGTIASGVKNMGLYTIHRIKRTCDATRCSDWLVEDDWRSGQQECKIIERDTGKVLRECRGEECMDMGMCR